MDRLLFDLHYHRNEAGKSMLETMDQHHSSSRNEMHQMFSSTRQAAHEREAVLQEQIARLKESEHSLAHSLDHLRRHTAGSPGPAAASDMSSELAVQVASLQGERDALEEGIAALTQLAGQLEVVQTERNDLQQGISDLVQERDSLLKERDSHMEELTRLKFKMNHHTRAVDELLQDTHSAESRAATATRRLEEFEASAKAHITHLESRIEEQRGMIEHMKQLGESRSAPGNAEDVAKDASARLERLAAEVGRRDQALEASGEREQRLQLREEFTFGEPFQDSGVMNAVEASGEREQRLQLRVGELQEQVKHLQEHMQGMHRRGVTADEFAKTMQDAVRFQTSRGDALQERLNARGPDVHPRSVSVRHADAPPEGGNSPRNLLLPNSSSAPAQGAASSRQTASPSAHQNEAVARLSQIASDVGSKLETLKQSHVTRLASLRL